MTKYIPIALIILASNVAFAEKIYKNSFNTCIPTKHVINNYEPVKFNPSNNLLRKPGGTMLGVDDQIVLRGKIVDIHCVPISDAKIYAWSAGYDGKYPYKPMRKKASMELVNLKSDSSFQGSGIATSDNNGEFQFITIRPEKHRMLNLRVEHFDLGTIQTAFAPEEDPAPQGGCGCIAPLPPQDTYDFVIVMDTRNPYRRY